MTEIRGRKPEDGGQNEDLSSAKGGASAFFTARSEIAPYHSKEKGELAPLGKLSLI